MEALAAVSLAGNVLQFVDSVKTLISFSRQISSFGATEEHIELNVIVQELKGLTSRVTPPKPTDDTELTPEDESVRTLAAQCNQVAEELLSVLESLKVKNSVGAHARFESVNKALLSVWKKPQIEELQRRLDRISANIEIHLATSKWDKLLKRLYDLGCENERLEARHEDDIQLLKNEFKDLLDGMKDNLSQSDTRSHAMTALLAAANTGSRYSAEQIILEHLRFDAMSLRYDTIHVAHRETLIWIFDKGGRRSPGTFDKWLLSDENLYWISGKPGSGKSTLMKFLCDHPRTLERLRVWAMNDRLVSAQYFLWNAGKDGLQKSQEGLLRSLVYQILRQCPDMIPLAYPNAWRVYFAEDGVPIDAPTAHSKDLDFRINLTVPGLLATLRDICTAAVASDTRLYFFIDGLDEYDGKPADMIRLICMLRKLPALKLCLSSRPWNEFEQEFGKNQARKLYMQDFNGPDIKAFVYDTIQQDENYKESETSLVDVLAQEIVEAANGVFLWVFLVVRSFQEGLLNGDRISYLRKRLRELPSDLNDYFEKILFHDVKKFYRARCAEMLSVTVAGAADLSFMVYWFMGDEDSDYALKLKFEPLAEKEIDDRLKSTKKQVNASCKGLLKAQYMPTSSINEDDSRSSDDREISLYRRGSMSKGGQIANRLMIKIKIAFLLASSTGKSTTSTAQSTISCYSMTPKTC